MYQLVSSSPLSLPSSDRFRLISRALSTHIYCQTPLDTNQTTILRVAPGSPGHIKDPYRNQPGFVASAIPLKQADQAFNNFEALMNNKNYASLKENTSYALGFISDLNHTILNTVDLLVYLSVWLYPQDRFLDALRVVQVWVLCMHTNMYWWQCIIATTTACIIQEWNEFTLFVTFLFQFSIVVFNVNHKFINEW